MVRPPGLQSPLWKRPPVVIVGIFLLAAALIWPVVDYARSIAEQRDYGPTVIGEITRAVGSPGRHSPTQSKYFDVVLSDGTEHRIVISDFRMVGCRVGLKIEVREYQGRYVLGPNGCNINENAAP